MSEGEVPTATRPEKTAVAFDRRDDELTIRWRSQQKAGGLFMLLWLIGWTVACVFLAAKVIKQPQLFNIAFAVPFWAAWIFICCMMVKTFTQREAFRLDADGAVFNRRAVVPIHSHSAPLAEIRSFGECRSCVVRDETPDWGIEMRTLGQSLQFAWNLSQQERVWLIAELNDHLHALQGSSRVSNSAKVEEREEEPSSGSRPDVERITLADDVVLPPSDCRWVRGDDYDGITFHQRGRAGAVGLLGLVFVNLFWNGIVSVFVMVLFGLAPGAPAGVMWWGLFVFLIPFEVIGLLMVGALLLALLEPFCTTTWRLGGDTIDCRITWFGIGKTWSYAVEPGCRLELRRGESAQQEPIIPARMAGSVPDSGSEGTNFILSVVNRENTELCAIERLTEGEARWIGDLLLRERPAWFR